MKAKEKIERKFVRGKREGLKSGKWEERREVRKTQ